MRLILARHGETAYNTENRFTGQSDIPLSALGKRQVQLLGDYLATEQLDAIVSSDLERTRDTARAIAQHHELEVLEDPDIREISMGTWEGLTFQDVVARDPDLVARWRKDPSTYAPTGGENIVQLRDRAAHALERWRSRYPDGTVVWVTHGGLIGVLICHLLTIDLNRRGQFRHDNASLSEFLLIRDWVSFVRLNETAFLRAQLETH